MKCTYCMLVPTQRPCLPPPCPGSKMLAGSTIFQTFIDDIVQQLIHAVQQDYWSLVRCSIRASTCMKLRNGAVHRCSLSTCVFYQNFIHPHFHNLELLVHHRFCEFITLLILSSPGIYEGRVPVPGYLYLMDSCA